MRKFVYLLFLVVFLVACSQDAEVLDTSASDLTIKAVIESSTVRTSFVEASASVLKLKWEGDEAFALSDGTTMHKFTRVKDDDFEPVQTAQIDYEHSYGYYPYSAVKDVQDESFNVNFPGAQTYVKDNIEDDMFPMIGKWSSGRMGFWNLASCLVFKIYATQAQDGLSLESVTLTADQPLSGAASVQFDTKDLRISADGSRSIVLNCKDVQLSSKTAVTCFLALPPGTYTDLKLSFRTSDCQISEYALEGEYIFERSTAYDMTLDKQGFVFDKERRLQELLEEQISSGCKPYVMSVYDVDYAPGQFVNTMPSGLTTKQSAIQSTSETIAGVASNTGMIHLGGWGGSVTVGFDHPILNLQGADFRGYGNGFGGSSEPGVYYVAQKDANGEPAKWYLIKHAMYDYSIHDYEITYYKPMAESITQYNALYWKGDYATTVTNVIKANFSKIAEIPSKDPNVSAWYVYNNAIYKDSGSSTATIKKLNKANTVTVKAPSKDAPATYKDGDKTYSLAYVASSQTSVIDQYIYWKDNKGHNGYECKNTYHSQSYWPEYAGESITIKGEYLPVNSFDESGSGTYYVQDAKYWGFPTSGVDASYTDPLDEGKSIGLGAYGYCDNYPNAHSLSCIDIDWAVDENGEHVHLDSIDFIKVQSGMHKQSGWLGEISTEFSGIDDLHLLGEKVYPTTTIKPNMSNIPRSGDPLQPETGLLYWAYESVDVISGIAE